MQRRMREFTMSSEAVDALLQEAPYGMIATLDEDGYPYTVAVHFVWLDGKLYFHGLGQGKKMDNLKRDSRVCFSVARLDRVTGETADTPCDADADYESVVIQGNAVILSNTEQKRGILQAIIKKFMPTLSHIPLSDPRVNGTAVVEITPREITGKYHR